MPSHGKAFGLLNSGPASGSVWLTTPAFCRMAGPMPPHTASSPCTVIAPSFTNWVAHWTSFCALFAPLQGTTLSARAPMPPCALMYCWAAMAAPLISGDVPSGLLSVYMTPTTTTGFVPDTELCAGAPDALGPELLGGAAVPPLAVADLAPPAGVWDPTLVPLLLLEQAERIV